MAKTWLKRNRSDDKNNVFWTVFGFRNSGCGGLPLLVRDLAHGPKRGSFQSHLGGLGRNSTELLNRTITEISSTKPRRANRNSQGAQRSWEAKHVRKASNQIKPNEVNQPTNNQSNDQSISQANNANQKNCNHTDQT